MRGPRSSRSAAALIPVALLLAVGCSRPPAERPPTSPEPRGQAGPPAFDGRLTDEARLLAGMVPDEATRFAGVTGDPLWQAYRAEFDRTWIHGDGGRFAAMRAWRDGELAPASRGPCTTLLYPFSGADIVNAWILFPDCERYVMFGLEPTGSFPKFEAMDGARVDRLLSNVRAVVADLFERNYFITKQMLAEFETPELDGTLPVIGLLLARLGSSIVAVTPLEIDREGRLIPAQAPAKAAGKNAALSPAGTLVPAVALDTLSRSGARQQIVYFRAQADNGPLAKHRGVEAFLASLRPYRTLVKSASYLMHLDGFSRIRSELLAGSSLILQDDTGIPFAFLNSPSWTVRLYGTYTKPVKDFGYAAEADLEAAFAQPGRARTLPFTWGYHWRDGASHLMLAIKNQGGDRP